MSQRLHIMLVIATAKAKNFLLVEELDVQEEFLLLVLLMLMNYVNVFLRELGLNRRC